jgi:hypothetical protein
MSRIDLETSFIPIRIAKNAEKKTENQGDDCAHYCVPDAMQLTCIPLPTDPFREMNPRTRGEIHPVPEAPNRHII